MWIKFLTFFSYLFFYYHLSAQEIVTSLHYQKNDPKPLWYEYCRSDGGLVTLSHTSKRSSRYIGLYKYDDEFEKTWSVELFEQNSRKKIEKLAILGDRILVFILEKFPREDVQSLFYYEYDLKGNEIEKQKEIYTIPIVKNNKKQGYSSPLNQNSLLHYYTTDDGEQKKLHFQLFEYNRPSFFSHSILLTQFDLEEELLDVNLTNQGNLILLSRVEFPNQGRRNKKYDYHITRYNIDSENLSTLKVDFPDVYITDLIIKSDINEHVIIGGFYSNNNSNQVRGLLYARIDPSNEKMEKTHVIPFDTEFLANYLSSKQIEKGREMVDFYLDQIVLRSDGGILILAEQFYISSTSYSSFNGIVYTKDWYHYDDIAIFSIDPNGQLEWNTIITKSQSAESTLELSYLPLVGESNIFLLYKTKEKGIGTNIFISRVQYNGRVDQIDVLFEDFSSYDQFYCENSEQISNTEGIIAYYKSRGRMFIISKVAF